MKKRMGIGAKLLLLVMIPLVLLTVILVYYTTSNLREKMDEQVAQGLHNVVYSLNTFYDTTYAEDYTISQEGMVTKGALVINDNYDILDGIKRELATDVTFFYGDTRISTTVQNERGDRATGTKAADVVTKEVIEKGNEYFDPKVQVNGVAYYGYYLPIKNSDGSVVGMLFAGKSSEEVDKEIELSVKNNLTVSFWVLFFAIILTVLFVIGLTRVIKNVQLALGEVAQGNLKTEIKKKTLRRKDELGDIARSLNSMQQKFLGIVTRIIETTKTLSTSAKQLEDNSQFTTDSIENINTAMVEIARGVGEQAEETQTSAQNISSMGELIHEEIKSVEELTQSATKMKTAEMQAGIYIESLVKTNDKTLGAIGKIEEQTHTTNESVQHIRQAVEMITSIARETNLLSLNASIEAARAGEHGKGFAVVAKQIQKLAEESNQSAKKIEIVINKLNKESEQSIVAMEEAKESMERQIEDLQKTKGKFDEMRVDIVSSAKNIQIVETQSIQIDNYRGTVVEALQNLAAISQENAASTEETTASIEEVNAMMDEFNDSAKLLNEMASSLGKEIEIFKI